MLCGMRERQLLGAAIVLAFFVAGACAWAQGARPPAGRVVDDPMRLELAAPIATWDEAVPLGNGMTGGLLWGEGRVLKLSLDRADLWDLRTPELYLADDWNYATFGAW